MKNLPLIQPILLIALLLASLGANASERDQSTESSAERKVLSRGLVKDELFSVQPLAGFLAYDDLQGNKATRMSVGLSVDMNLVRTSSQMSNEWYGGLSSGLIYSHLGDPGSNFFGNGSDSAVGHQSAYMMIIPANFKLGLAPSDYYRISIHAGANILYRSLVESVSLSDQAPAPGSAWNLKPNIGFDVDVAINKNLSITVRPDWTFTSGSNLFSGTIALGFFLS